MDCLDASLLGTKIFLQNVGVYIDIITLYVLTQYTWYFLLSSIASIALNGLVFIIIGFYTFSKIENFRPEELYLKKHYFIILFAFILCPPLNFYIFLLDDDNIVQTGLFLYKYYDLSSTIIIKFLSIHLNIYQLFKISTDNFLKEAIFSYSMISLGGNLFFASIGIVSIHAFLYTRSIKTILNDEPEKPPESMVTAMKRYHDCEEYRWYHMIFMFIIFIADFYGFSVLWGVVSQIWERFTWLLIAGLFFVALSYIILTFPYFACKWCFAKDEERKTFSFRFIDNFLSVLCLPFGPLSISLVYYVIKTAVALGYLGIGGYLIFSYRSESFDAIYTNYWKKRIFLTGMLSLLIFIIAYPLFLYCFQNLKEQSIEDNKTKKLNESLKLPNSVTVLAEKKEKTLEAQKKISVTNEENTGDVLLKKEEGNTKLAASILRKEEVAVEIVSNVKFELNSTINKDGFQVKKPDQVDNSQATNLNQSKAHPDIKLKIEGKEGMSIIAKSKAEPSIEMVSKENFINKEPSSDGLNVVSEVIETIIGNAMLNIRHDVVSSDNKSDKNSNLEEILVKSEISYSNRKREESKSSPHVSKIEDREVIYSKISQIEPVTRFSKHPDLASSILNWDKSNSKINRTNKYKSGFEDKYQNETTPGKILKEEEKIEIQVDIKEDEDIKVEIDEGPQEKEYQQERINSDSVVILPDIEID